MRRERRDPEKELEKYEESVERHLELVQELTDQTIDMLIDEGDEDVKHIAENTTRVIAKYKPEVVIPKLLDAMAKGASRPELCAELNVLPNVIDAWETRYPSFAKAMVIGEALCEAWWRKSGRENLHNPYFNNILWMMNMSNRYGWSRKTEGAISISTTEKKVLQL